MYSIRENRTLLPQVEGSIHYHVPVCDKDIRFPQRKLAFADDLRETIFTGLPVSKWRLKAKEREAFYCANGSRTTNDPSYHNVPVRLLGDLPRISKQAKQEVMRLAQPPELPEGFIKYCGKGHPLRWQELKSIKLWTQLFRNHDLAHVFNLTECSGAAAIAALSAGVGYEGVCANEQHAKWVDKLMDKAALAVYLQGEDIRQPLSEAFFRTSGLFQPISVRGGGVAAAPRTDRFPNVILP